MRILSLCSGIGGFELGAKLVNQRLGKEVFQLKALCEKNQFCRDRALKPNFPGIPIYEDIRDIPAISGTYDLIVGGLPCQPFSLAGKQKGKADDRNLFPEFFRLFRGIRPIGAVIENVPGLLSADSGRFFRDILWHFTQAGYSVEWNVISCAEVGGVHKRDRLWIVAHSNSQPEQRSGKQAQSIAHGRAAWLESQRKDTGDRDGFTSNSNSQRHHKPEAFSQSAHNSKWDNPAHEQSGTTELHASISSSATFTHTASERLPNHPGRAQSTGRKEPDINTVTNANGFKCLQRQRISEGQERECLPNTIRSGRGCINADSDSERLEAWQRCSGEQATIGELERSSSCNNREDETQPGIRSGNDGIPAQLVRSHLMIPEELPDRLPYATDSENIPYRKEMLQALGNAIVPDVAAIALYKFLEIANLMEDAKINSCQE